MLLLFAVRLSGSKVTEKKEETEVKGGKMNE